MSWVRPDIPAALYPKEPGKAELWPEAEENSYPCSAAYASYSCLTAAAAADKKPSLKKKPQCPGSVVFSAVLKPMLKAVTTS